MAQFLYIFRGGGYATGNLSPTELEKHLAKWKAWTDGLVASGKLASATPLTHPPTGATVRGTARLVTDGPFAEAKDLVSGIVVVDTVSLAEATELARGCPILEMDGSVEVRPVIAKP